jgi:hypothetical protein
LTDIRKISAPVLRGETVIDSIVSEEDFMLMYEMYYERTYSYLFFVCSARRLRYDGCAP